MTVQEHELDRTTASDMWQCRYRYATNCTTTSIAKQGMYTHEKSAVAHADHRVTLRDCPECGMPCGDEGKRGMHMAAEHGIRAGSEYRQELDAKQVEAIFKARQAEAAALPAEPDAPAEEDYELADPYRPIPSGYEALESLNGAAPNGHSPAALDLSAAQDMFIAMAAELKELRAWKAAHEADAALLAQMRDLLPAWSSA